MATHLVTYRLPSFCFFAPAHISYALQGLEEEVVATVALNVLRGLEYMHSHCMIHRDVKVWALRLSKGKYWSSCTRDGCTRLRT